MSEEDGESAWHEVLHARLEASGRSDESIIDFIEEEVPDEGDILDYKQDLYISASSSHHDKKRQANLMKHFSALANVRTPARFRYIFIGFDNDGNFTGMQYRVPRDGDQVLDVDDADLRNVFADKVSPSPDFEVFELERNGDRGGVIVIHQGAQVPLVIEKTLRKEDGSAFIYEGQAYTRDGSRSARMTSDDFAAMMRYREELITGKIQELTEGLSQVVGIPDDQLANLDLNVTQSDDGVPVRELVTMDAPKTVDEELKTAVKGSKGSGGYEYQRRGLYEFLAQRDSVDLDDEGEPKIEFLVRASLRKHIHGAYWLAKYRDDTDELLERIISEDVNGTTIKPLERILLVLGKQSYLQEIDNMYGSKYISSQASEFERHCDRGIHHRVAEYTGENVKVGDTSYSVRDLVYGNGDDEPEELMAYVVDDLLNDDNPTDRARLRKIELIYLAATA
ncbi:ATP-binding protein [Haloferax denitrificans]|uniref:ATP-binding protein n=1 Tax=Haloferax denitrificans TaxID=35745 RepID=UPI003C6F71BD